MRELVEVMVVKKLCLRVLSNSVEQMLVKSVTKLIVMAFKPLYALKIVNRVKDCEVRTYFGNIERNDLVLIYASSPRKAFLGIFRVLDIAVGYYDDIVSYLRKGCKFFDEDNWHFIEEHYSKSWRKLMVIKIGDVKAFPREAPLHEVRKYIPSYRPPLSYVQASHELVSVLKQILGASVWEDIITKLSKGEFHQ